MKIILKMTCSLILSWLVLWGCQDHSTKVGDIPASRVVPSQNQLVYQEMEMVGFIHFTVNTFTNKEWGYGDEDPSIFNPTEPDVAQWIKTAKAGGLKELILTAKHHDGFCLWPSKYTAHSIKNSPYKDGKGDIVREFVDACRKYDLKAGLYLSPWDRNHPAYGYPEYITYYRNQLTELLTEYGEINEIWFDGANGGEGYYGGANENRKIDKETYYDWDSTQALVKKLQPNIKIFSDAGPDIHWIGNERGITGKTFWSTISPDQLVIGGSNGAYLNEGDPNGDAWIIGQCDVSIRPGWFYHASQDSLVKSPQQLIDIYYQSVGRNAVFLLNLPPDQRGLIHENDVKSLVKFKAILDETFAVNLAANQPVSATNYRFENAKFSPANITDDDLASYWSTDSLINSATLEIDLGETKEFDRIMLQEPIRFGQRINQFSVLVWDDDRKDWKELSRGTTIGYKRLLRFPTTRSTKVKLEISTDGEVPAISNVGVYKASTEESL